MSMTADTHSFSPHLMASDLGLDPSDPLNLLLHNTTQSNSSDSSMDDSSCEGASPPNWSELSALWPENEPTTAKPYQDAMEFVDFASFQPGTDFNPTMSIEPSALHFDYAKYGIQGYSYNLPVQMFPNESLSTPFPFTFQPLIKNEGSSLSVPSEANHRRLSVASSSSSSASTMSPSSESISSPTISVATHSSDVLQPANEASTATALNDPAAEIAEKVRKAAGVMLALPMNLQGVDVSQHLSAPSTNVPAPPPKLPIPRLARHPSQSVKSSSTVSSAASTPPPSTPSPPPTSSNSTPSPPSSQSQSSNHTNGSTVQSRPKTSHTTIERRYRTNLNARIQSLRMAVPALRVVEDREGKKKAPNKVLVNNGKVEGTVFSFGGVVDVVDERGFVDGVKVARKCSKANVLGKAVEYIRVLKKRELRLRAEQSGLKSLISGLVGGPALLREWEREWKERFGGEEKDEVEGEMDGEGDDDDSDDEQDELDDEVGRKRKRVKASPPAPLAKKEKDKRSVQEMNGAPPEKRKRGRPRKVIPPAVPVGSKLSISVEQQDQDQSMTDTSSQDEAQQEPQQYLLAVFALFSFFNSPIATSKPSTPHVHTGVVLNASTLPVVEESWGFKDYMQTFHLLVSFLVLVGLVSKWIGYGSTNTKAISLLRFVGLAKSATRRREDWVKSGEKCILSGEQSNRRRVQIYHNISSLPNASVEDTVTAALVLYGVTGLFGSVARAKARATWSACRSKANARPSPSYEAMVLDNMDIGQAATRLTEHARITTAASTDSPLHVLGCLYIRERMRKHLGSLFIEEVHADGNSVEDKASYDEEMTERRQTVDAAKELDGQVMELGRNFERVWKLNTDMLVDLYAGSADGSEDNGGRDSDNDVEALLSAIVLCRRVFATSTRGHGPSGLLSPPPSPRRRDTSDAAKLRQILGNRVFERSDALEDARDRAVDMIVGLERRSVGLD